MQAHGVSNATSSTNMCQMSLWPKTVAGAPRKGVRGWVIVKIISPYSLQLGLVLPTKIRHIFFVYRPKKTHITPAGKHTAAVPIPGLVLAPGCHQASFPMFLSL